jgi:hypothetical protein
MKAIIRRLRQLEERIEPPTDQKSRAAATLIRERRRRRLEAAGLQLEEPLPLPARMTIAETLRYLRTQRLKAGTK